MKKVLLIVVFIAVVLILAGCSDSKYPYVTIMHDQYTSHNTVIPIGSGYHLTKQIFTIEEHKDGYDIIIHVKAGLGD